MPRVRRPVPRPSGTCGLQIPWPPKPWKPVMVEEKHLSQIEQLNQSGPQPATHPSPPKNPPMSIPVRSQIPNRNPDNQEEDNRRSRHPNVLGLYSGALHCVGRFVGLDLDRGLPAFMSVAIVSSVFGSRSAARAPGSHPLDGVHNVGLLSQKRVSQIRGPANIEIRRRSRRRTTALGCSIPFCWRAAFPNCGPPDFDSVAALFLLPRPRRRRSHQDLAQQGVG